MTVGAHLEPPSDSSGRLAEVGGRSSDALPLRTLLIIRGRKRDERLVWGIGLGTSLWDRFSGSGIGLVEENLCEFERLSEDLGKVSCWMAGAEAGGSRVSSVVELLIMKDHLRRRLFVLLLPIDARKSSSMDGVGVFWVVLAL